MSRADNRGIGVALCSPCAGAVRARSRICATKRQSDAYTYKQDLISILLYIFMFLCVPHRFVALPRWTRPDFERNLK